jgi:hypothetical protein
MDPRIVFGLAEPVFSDQMETQKRGRIDDLAEQTPLMCDELLQKDTDEVVGLLLGKQRRMLPWLGGWLERYVWGTLANPTIHESCIGARPLNGATALCRFFTAANPTKSRCHVVR